MTKECSSNIQNTTNTRLYERNIPSHVIQPYFDVRPASTKHSILPIVEQRKINTVPVEQYAVYSPHRVFHQGNTRAPWSGYASEINTESQLRNQLYSLQKASQNVYVPNSNSDLYNYQFTNSASSGKNVVQPFQGLFQEETFAQFNPNTHNIGNDRFNNSTRVQLKNTDGKQSSSCVYYQN